MCVGGIHARIAQLRTMNVCRRPAASTQQFRLSAGVQQGDDTGSHYEEPGGDGGKPCVRGMRVAVGMIVGLVVAG